MDSTGGRPSDVAFAGEGRIGEASNPGPRRPLGRTGYLDDVTLVEPKTLAIQARVWNDFSDWLNSQLSAEAVDSVLKHFGAAGSGSQRVWMPPIWRREVFILLSSPGGLHSAVLCRCQTLSTMLLGPGMGNL